MRVEMEALQQTAVNEDAMTDQERVESCDDFFFGIHMFTAIIYQRELYEQIRVLRSQNDILKRRNEVYAVD